MDITFLFLSDYYYQLNNTYPSTSKNTGCVTYKSLFGRCSMVYNNDKIIENSSENIREINLYKGTINTLFKHNDPFNSS
jgi:hypothetical protein